MRNSEYPYEVARCRFLTTLSSAISNLILISPIDEFKFLISFDAVNLI